MFIWSYEQQFSQRLFYTKRGSLKLKLQQFFEEGPTATDKLKLFRFWIVSLDCPRTDQDRKSVRADPFTQQHVSISTVYLTLRLPSVSGDMPKTPLVPGLIYAEENTKT